MWGICRLNIANSYSISITNKPLKLNKRPTYLRKKNIIFKSAFGREKVVRLENPMLQLIFQCDILAILGVLTYLFHCNFSSIASDDDMFFSQRHPLQPLFFLFDLLQSRQSQSPRAILQNLQNLPGIFVIFGVLQLRFEKKTVEKGKHPNLQGEVLGGNPIGFVCLERSTEDSEWFVTVGGYHLESMRDRPNRPSPSGKMSEDAQ